MNLKQFKQSWHTIVDWKILRVNAQRSWSILIITPWVLYSNFSLKNLIINSINVFRDIIHCSCIDSMTVLTRHTSFLLVTD